MKRREGAEVRHLKFTTCIVRIFRGLVSSVGRASDFGSEVQRFGFSDGSQVCEVYFRKKRSC